jgi:hypothetical protein
LSQLVEASGGIALWAGDVRQLGILFGVLARVLDGSAQVQKVRFQIQSSTDGAFQSGRTVLGTVHFEDCNWDYCVETDIPFAVRIP